MIVNSNKKDKVTEEDEDDDDDDDEEEEDTITSKLQHVLAAKSRKLQYTLSPVISHHLSLSLLSSPDDLSSHSRASVPFSWEEEPGKPKHNNLLRAPPNYSKRLHLPPRLLLPTKMPLASDHRRHLAGLKRWFRWKKDRANDEDDVNVAGKCSFVLSSGSGNDKKITRSGGCFHCLSDVSRCYFWQVPWNQKKLKKMAFKRRYVYLGFNLTGPSSMGFYRPN